MTRLFRSRMIEFPIAEQISTNGEATMNRLPPRNKRRFVNLSTNHTSVPGNNVPSKVRNCINAQYHTICAVKSPSHPLATFQKIGTIRKQEAIWIKCALCSYFDKLLYLF